MKNRVSRFALAVEQAIRSSASVSEIYRLRTERAIYDDNLLQLLRLIEDPEPNGTGGQKSQLGVSSGGQQTRNEIDILQARLGSRNAGILFDTLMCIDGHLIAYTEILRKRNNESVSLLLLLKSSSLTSLPLERISWTSRFNRNSENDFTAFGHKYQPIQNSRI